jgi:hypothetical protein
MATIGSIIIRIGAETAPFLGGLKQAGTGLRGFVSSLEPVGGQVKGFLGSFAGVDSIKGKLLGLGAALSVAGLATGLVSITKGAIEAVDALNDTAGKLGTTTEQLSELRYAAEITGSHAEDLDAAIGKMNANLGDAAAKGGPAADALKKLGLSAGDLVKLDPGDAFKKIAGGFAKLSGPAEQAAVALDIFGKGGINVLNTLKAGPEVLAKMADEAKRLGVSVSSVDAAQIGATKDALDRAGFAIEGIKNRIAVELAPVLEAAANKLTEFAASGEGAGARVALGMRSVVEAVAFVADAVNGFQVFWKLAGVAVDAVCTTIAIHVLDIGRALGTVLSYLPGFDASFVATLGNISDALKKDLAMEWADFEKALDAPPPGDGMRKWFDDLAAASKAAAAATANAGKQINGAISDTAKVAAKVEELTKALTVQRDTFGLSSRQAEIYKLKLEGATPAMLKSASALADQLDTFDFRKESRQQAEAIIESTRTATEKVADAQEHLQALFDRGLLDATQYARGIVAARKEAGFDSMDKRSAALELGSKEARSSILDLQMKGSNDPIRDVAQTAKQQLAVQLRLPDLLQKIADAVVGGVGQLFPI